jgi:hypothetical protein
MSVVEQKIESTSSASVFTIKTKMTMISIITILMTKKNNGKYE